MRGGAAAQRPSAADGAAEHGEQIFFRKMREAFGDVAVFGRARGVILQRLIVVRLAAAEQDGDLVREGGDVHAQRGDDFLHTGGDLLHARL